MITSNLKYSNYKKDKELLLYSQIKHKQEASTSGKLTNMKLILFIFLINHTKFAPCVRDYSVKGR